MIKTVEWTDAGVRMIDQRLLPTEEKYLTLRFVRGSCRRHQNHGCPRARPAIGVSAAMGAWRWEPNSFVGTSVADLEIRL